MAALKKLFDPLIRLNNRFLAWQRRHPILDFILFMFVTFVVVFLCGFVLFDTAALDMDYLHDFMDSSEACFFEYCVLVCMLPIIMIYTRVSYPPLGDSGSSVEVINDENIA